MINLNLHSLVLAALMAAPMLHAVTPESLREATAKRTGESPVVKGNDGWLFLPSELRHISAGKFWGEEAAAVSKAPKPETANPLPAILDTKAQLEAAGIELILLPVPAKAHVYPEALLEGGDPSGPAPERADSFHQEFYELLRSKGITVIDLLPDFLAQRNAEENPVYCRTDTHWSGRGIQIAAEKITAELAGRPWLKDAAKTPTSVKSKPIEILGDLQGMLGAEEQETVALRFVGTEESSGETAVPADKTSPVVLLGDSHTLVFNAGADMHTVGAGLADQLVHELGVPVDLAGVRGSGATPARVNLMRRARADAGYLAGKKVIIWCFTVREFTEASGWSNVPLPKP